MYKLPNLKFETCYQVSVLKDDYVEGLIDLEYSIIAEIQLEKQKLKRKKRA